MHAHKVKTQGLLTIILITAFPLSLFALAINGLETMSILAGNVQQFEFYREVSHADENVMSGNGIPESNLEVNGDNLVPTWDNNLKLNMLITSTNDLTADLSLAKGVNDPTPGVGDTIVFTIEVGNSGPDDATGVSVSDTLPSGYNYAGDNSGGTYSDTIGLWAVGEIANGISKTVNISAEVLPTGIYSNYAQVAKSNQQDPDSQWGDNSIGDDDDDTVVTAPKPVSDLSITKDVDNATPFVGTQVVFTLRVDNIGPADANSVIVNDLLPSGYTHVTNDGGGDYVPGTGVWTVETIPAPGSAELHITATVNAIGNYTNIAQITKLDEKDPQSNNNQDSATTTPRFADLSMTKDVDNATPFVGDQVVFTLQVENGGPSDATGVLVSDPLPSGYTYVSDTGSGSYLHGIGLWVVGDIADGASTDLQITALVRPDGDYTNTAQITELNEFDSKLDNNQDSATTIPVPVADLEINKIASSDRVAAGDNLTFTLVVTNHGPSSATNVQVTDDLAAEFQLIAANSTQGSCNDNDLVICNIGNLAKDEVVTVTIVVNVDRSASGSLENTGSVSSLTFDPLDGRKNSDTISINLLERIVLIMLPIINSGQDYGEPNDQCATAADILVNEDNTFLPEDQNDWYQFDIASSGKLVVELSNFQPMEGQLTVYRGSSCTSRLFLGINGNIAANKVLDLSTQPAGHYYIYVSNDNTFSSVPYTLRVNFMP